MNPSDPAKRVLITGGAGFVGSNLCLALAERHPDWEVVAFDNLRRRGSELNLPRLREGGVAFVHGDVRNPADLAEVERIDALVECSAEPSVMAGVGGDPSYAVDTNLVGAFHCLERARRDGAQVVFLSTSRVYPVEALERLAFSEAETRFELTDDQPAGASAAGVSETFGLEGARTLYGATKLAAELLVAEYAASYELPAVVNRCGVITGPWQMGKVDQGVFTFWILAHLWKRPLRYIGYGGSGKQVRDLIHVEDLVELIDEQLVTPERWRGMTVNVGGGVPCSLSLRETTDLCREITGNEVPVSGAGEDRPGDVRIYLSDCSRLFGHTSWRPRRGPADILEDIFSWAKHNERAIAAALD